MTNNSGNNSADNFTNSSNSENNNPNTEPDNQNNPALSKGGTKLVGTNLSYNDFDKEFLAAIQKFEPLFDEPIAKYSTWKIGGPARVLIKTNNSEELEELCMLCDRFGINFRVVGRISNMLVSDKGFDGVLIVTKDKKIEIH